MTDWQSKLRGDPIPWLLEEDNPPVRYFTLREVLGHPEDAPLVQETRTAIMDSPWVQGILAAQYPAGYWIKPDRGYSPRYRATVWQVLFLADLGAKRVPAIERACEHVLTHTYRPDLGLFSAHKHSTGVIACLNGNLLRALSWFGYGEHPVVRRVTETLAQWILRDGFRCRYNAAEPRRRETWLPCAWGCIKVLRGFAALPTTARSETVLRAAKLGVDFLLQHDLVRADYPTSTQPSPLWWRFGFPLGYTSDALEALQALVNWGAGDDPRLAGAWTRVLEKQDEQGRWPLEYTPEKTWVSFGRRGEPSKWVTLRAVRALQAPKVF